MPLLELDGRTAWDNVFSNQGRPRFPRSDSPRLVPWASPQVEASFKIPPGAKIFTVGSCFARNIEQHLAQHHFDVPSHRYFGASHVINKYNPYAILQEFRGAFFPNERIPTEQRLFEVESGDWIDLHLHFANPLPRERIVAHTEQCHKLFLEVMDSPYFIITLGLIEVWYDRECDCYLNEPLNFGRLYRANKKLQDYFAERFVFQVLNYQETYDATYRIFALLREHGTPGLKVILTVSPVPLSGTFTGRDVLMPNMYSKSVLRAVAEEIRGQFDFIDYFPSYESVMLSPRQTAWEEDGVHVTDAAVAFNVRRMVDAYLQPVASAAE
jgi:GSCFA family